MYNQFLQSLAVFVCITSVAAAPTGTTGTACSSVDIGLVSPNLQYDMFIDMELLTGTCSAQLTKGNDNIMSLWSSPEGNLCGSCVRVTSNITQEIFVVFDHRGAYSPEMQMEIPNSAFLRLTGGNPDSLLNSNMEYEAVACPTDDTSPITDVNPTAVINFIDSLETSFQMLNIPGGYKQAAIADEWGNWQVLQSTTLWSTEFYVPWVYQNKKKTIALELRNGQFVMFEQDPAKSDENHQSSVDLYSMDLESKEKIDFVLKNDVCQVPANEELPAFRGGNSGDDDNNDDSGASTLISLPPLAVFLVAFVNILF